MVSLYVCIFPFFFFFFFNDPPPPEISPLPLPAALPFWIISSDVRSGSPDFLNVYVPPAPSEVEGPFHSSLDATSSAIQTSPPALRPALPIASITTRSEEHTSELQSLTNLVCRLLLEKKK